MENFNLDLLLQGLDMRILLIIAGATFILRLWHAAPNWFAFWAPAVLGAIHAVLVVLDSPPIYTGPYGIYRNMFEQVLAESVVATGIAYVAGDQIAKRLGLNKEPVQEPPKQP